MIICGACDLSIEHLRLPPLGYDWVPWGLFSTKRMDSLLNQVNINFRNHIPGFLGSKNIIIQLQQNWCLLIDPSAFSIPSLSLTVSLVSAANPSALSFPSLSLSLVFAHLPGQQPARQPYPSHLYSFLSAPENWTWPQSFQDCIQIHQIHLVRTF